MSNAVYSADKPADCAYCYFWRGKKKGCELSSCYYLIQPVEQETAPHEPGKIGDCKSCPYGRHSPCIGFCMAKILQEMKEQHG